MYNISLKNRISCKGVNIPRLYLVGGTVRDLLLDIPSKDIDLVCKSAKVFARALARCRNAALVPMEKKPDEPCFRIIERECSDYYIDIAEMRGETIYEDLGRRDFSINAIAVEVNKDGSTGATIDPLKGVEDLKARIIRMAGVQSIVSDPLRILRAIRLAATLNFTIEEATLREMEMHAPLLRSISAERILTELMLILKAPASVQYFRQMDKLGILEVIFPEIRMMKGCRQNGFHHTDVWEHSLLVMEHAEHIINNLSGYFGEWSDRVEELLNSGNRLCLLKLSALLHDAGKPSTWREDPDTGPITFYGHDEEGAKLIGDIANRLKMSHHDKAFMVLLTAGHMQAFALASKDVRQNTKIKWFRKTGEDAIPAIILSMADTMGSLGPASSAGARERHIKWSEQSIRVYFEKIKAMLESPNLVTGGDLIALGLKPGPEIGNILKEIRKAQDTGDIKNRDEALELAKKLLLH